jgi:hypothetical protein
MRPCAQRGKNRWASPQYTPDDDQPVARRRGGARHCLMGVTPLYGMAMEWHPGDRLRTCHRAAWPYVMSRMMSCKKIGGHPRGFGPARPAHTSRTGSRFLDQTSPWPPLLASRLHWGVIGSSQCGGGVAWPIVRGRVAQCGDSDPLVDERPKATARAHDASNISTMTITNHLKRRLSISVVARHPRPAWAQPAKTTLGTPSRGPVAPHSHP